MYKRCLVGKEISLLSHLWSFIYYKKHWIVNIFIFTYVDIKPTSVVSKNCSTGTLVRMPTCLPLLVLPRELFWEERRCHPCQKRLRRNSFQNQESWWRGSSFSSTQNFCCTSCVKEPKQLLGRFECTCLETAVQQAGSWGLILHFSNHKDTWAPCSSLQANTGLIFVSPNTTLIFRRRMFFSVADTTIQFMLPFGLINVL